MAANLQQANIVGFSPDLRERVRHVRKGATMTEGKIRAVALAIFVRPRDQAVLAIRFDDRGYIFYRPPGGGIEFGESSCEAACREALEELAQPAAAERLTQGIPLFPRDLVKQLEALA